MGKCYLGVDERQMSRRTCFSSAFARLFPIVWLILPTITVVVPLTFPEVQTSSRKEPIWGESALLEGE